MVAGLLLGLLPSGDTGAGFTAACSGDAPSITLSCNGCGLLTDGGDGGTATRGTAGALGGVGDRCTRRALG